MTARHLAMAILILWQPCTPVAPAGEAQTPQPAETDPPPVVPPRPGDWARWRVQAQSPLLMADPHLSTEEQERQKPVLNGELGLRAETAGGGLALVVTWRGAETKRTARVAWDGHPLFRRLGLVEPCVVRNRSPVTVRIGDQDVAAEQRELACTDAEGKLHTLLLVTSPAIRLGPVRLIAQKPPGLAFELLAFGDAAHPPPDEASPAKAQ